MNTPIPRWLQVVVVAALAVPAALNTLATYVDHDTWWHLAVGKIVADTRTVPHVDPFSRMSRETPTPWAAYSWLFEWVLYQAYMAGGAAGVMWFRTLLAASAAASVSALAFRRSGETAPGLMFAALAPVGLMTLGTERPWHVSIAFTVATAWAVTAVRDGYPVRRVFAWLPLVYVVWANVHIQFVQGWGVLGIACLFPGKASRVRVVALTAACVLATVVNPYGVGLFRVIWEYTTHSAPLKLVAEMAPADLDKVWTWATFALLGAAGVGVARRKPLDGFAVLLLVSGVVFAARTRRDVWFGLVAAAAVVRPGDFAPGRFRRRMLPAAVAGAFFGIRLLNAGGFAWRNDFAAAQADEFPVAAARYVNAHALPGPLFNDYNWGGYLIWAVPEHPVTIDGRANLYGDARLLRSADSWATPTGRLADPDFLSCNLVVGHPDTPLSGALRTDPAWRVAFEDGTAVVFARK